MIKIGEFSTLTGISIHMLRNYDKIGLLSPASIDEASGYRYYSEEQIPLANQIVVLKNLGFGLKEIAGIQLRKDSIESTKTFIQQKIAEKKEEISLAQEQLHKMQQAVKELAKDETRSLSVTVKNIPERRVASIRGTVHHFQDEGELWTSLGILCNALHISSGEKEANRYSYAITHKLDFVNQNEVEIDVEVQRVIEQIPDLKLQKQAQALLHQMNLSDRTLAFLTIPACQAAVLAFRGQYSQLGEINTYMADWIKRNGYRIAGISFVTYYRSPGNEENPDNFITEVCFPIKIS